MKTAEDLALAALESEKQRRRRENRLAYYKPYLLQAKFHAAGATHRERLLMAGNQLGKTLAGGFEAAMHATGRYPDWWEGRPLRQADHWVGVWCDRRSRAGHRAKDTRRTTRAGRNGSDPEGRHR